MVVWRGREREDRTREKGTEWDGEKARRNPFECTEERGEDVVLDVLVSLSLSAIVQLVSIVRMSVNLVGSISNISMNERRRKSLAWKKVSTIWKSACFFQGYCFTTCFFFWRREHGEEREADEAFSLFSKIQFLKWVWFHFLMHSIPMNSFVGNYSSPRRWRWCIREKEKPSFGRLDESSYSVSRVCRANSRSPSPLTKTKKDHPAYHLACTHSFIPIQSLIKASQEAVEFTSDVSLIQIDEDDGISVIFNAAEYSVILLFNRRRRRRLFMIDAGWNIYSSRNEEVADDWKTEKIFVCKRCIKS